MLCGKFIAVKVLYLDIVPPLLTLVIYLTHLMEYLSRDPDAD